MALQILCDEYYSKYGDFCIYEEDVLIIIVNIIFAIAVIGLIYKYQFSKLKTDNISCTVSNTYLLLQTGAMDDFYQVGGKNMKGGTKKKGAKRNINRNIDYGNKSFDFKCNSINK